jgi:hypothetical protein
LNTQNSNPVSDQLEQLERNDEAVAQPSQEKKPFVEPVVSVPVDVLEATSFFQGPTVTVTSTTT